MNYGLNDPPGMLGAPTSRACACGASVRLYPVLGTWIGPSRCDACIKADEESRREKGALDAAARIAEEVERQAVPAPIDRLPSSLQGQRFEDYRCPDVGGPGDAQAREMTRQWATGQFPRLCLYGPTGVGKTLLAAAAACQSRFVPMTPEAWHDRLRGSRRVHQAHGSTGTFQVAPEVADGRDARVIRGLHRRWEDRPPPRQVDVVFTSVTRLLHELRLRIDRNQSVSEEVDRLVTVEVLILDDLGAERPTAWSTEQLEFVLDQRGAEGRRTLITTNLTRGEIARYYQDERRSTGHRIASRLSDFTTVHVKAAGDYRVSRAR